VKDEFGCETTYVENVDLADGEAAYRDFAVQGYDLIIGHGFQYGEQAKAVSADFPDIYFMATESDSMADNMSSYVMGCEQGAYLMGMLCAGMSESNIIGVVGGFEQPSITKEHEAFKLGAAEINPDVEVLEVYINSFTDATLGKEAGESMIRQGADVLYHVANQAGTGTITAAQENDLFVCGNSYDQASIAPENVLCSTVYSMPNVIRRAVNDVLNGTFVGGVYNLGMAEEVVSITGYGALDDQVPQELKDAIADKVAAITDGSFEVPVIGSPT
jgi:basic membrane protein A